jgi:hypothetical protein
MPSLPCNMSTLDRVLRSTAATAFILLVVLTDHLADAPALALGGCGFAALNIFAGITGFCLMYRFTGTDSRRQGA